MECHSRVDGESALRQFVGLFYGADDARNVIHVAIQLNLH